MQSQQCKRGSHPWVIFSVFQCELYEDQIQDAIQTFTYKRSNVSLASSAAAKLISNQALFVFQAFPFSVFDELRELVEQFLFLRIRLTRDSLFLKLSYLITFVQKGFLFRLEQLI